MIHYLSTFLIKKTKNVMKFSTILKELKKKKTIQSFDMIAP